MSAFKDFCKISCTEFPFCCEKTGPKDASTKAAGAGWLGGRVHPLFSLHPRAAHACLPGKKESLWNWCYATYLLALSIQVIHNNFFHTENCIYPLGLESGEITDEALTHSVDTTLTVSDPSGIRLNKNPGGFPNGWQAAMGTLDYIQVEKFWVNLAILFCLWLSQLTYFVKCRRTLQGLSSLERHPSSERERKFRRACLRPPYNVKLAMFTSRSPAATA